jgi:hypothetical protein
MKLILRMTTYQWQWRFANASVGLTRLYKIPLLVVFFIFLLSMFKSFKILNILGVVICLSAGKSVTLPLTFFFAQTK